MKEMKSYPFEQKRKKRLSLNIELRSSLACIPNENFFFRWVYNALPSGYTKAEIGLLLCDEAEAREYNLQYRKKDYATNVLSFHFSDNIIMNDRGILVGDLIICPDIVLKEAKEQEKSFEAHIAHLITHGILHLCGFDHENEEDAYVMEQLEVDLLEKIGFNNPYN